MPGRALLRTLDGVSDPGGRRQVPLSRAGRASPETRRRGVDSLYRRAQAARVARGLSHGTSGAFSRMGRAFESSALESVPFESAREQRALSGRAAR